MESWQVQLLEALPQAVCIQQDQKIRYANAACASLFGLASARDLLGKGWEMLASPDDWPSLWRQTLACLREEGPGPEVRWRRLHTNGAQVWVESAATQIDWQGRPAVLFSLRDVTEQKLREEQHLQEQKMELLGHMAGGVAHDVNNLMTIILGFAETLLRDLAPEHPHQDKLSEIVKASRQVSELTEHVLAFSRKQPAEPQLARLNDLVVSITNMIGRALGKHIALDINLQPDLGHVRAEPAQLSQVVLNLILNARDAMPLGGKLSIQTANLDEPAYAAGLPRRSAGYVLLTIRDTGCGMDAATQARVFEPFFTTKKAGKGTGLGLATVQRIVTQHGGKIQIESSAGQGATFNVFFPRTNGLELAPASLPAPARQETILVVDPDGYAPSSLDRLLQRLGFPILHASDALEAREAAAQHAGPLHLLVLEAQVPRVAGAALASDLLREHPQLRVLYVLASFEQLSLGEEAPEELADRVLVLPRPFTPAYFLSQVERLLRGEQVA
jgi:PAS domain S-box-containing protein